MLQELLEWLDDFKAMRNKDIVGNAIMLLLVGFAIGFILAIH